MDCKRYVCMLKDILKAEFCMDLVNFVYTSDGHVFRCFLERLFFVFDMHFSVCTLSALQVFIERI